MEVLCSSAADKESPKESMLEDNRSCTRKAKKVQFRALARVRRHTSIGRPI